MGSQSQDLVRRPFTKTTSGVEGVGAGGWKRTQEMAAASAAAERGILWWVSWEVMADSEAGYQMSSQLHVVLIPM